jgi:hypothetical protein
MPESRYGRHHKALHKRLEPLVASVQANCARCGKPIAPGEAWDLDHLDGAGPYDYAGPSHAACNRRARARWSLDW